MVVHEEPFNPSEEPIYLDAFIGRMNGNESKRQNCFIVKAESHEGSAYYTLPDWNIATAGCPISYSLEILAPKCQRRSNFFSV